MEIKKYNLGDMSLSYLISEEKEVSMILLPAGENMVYHWEKEKTVFDPGNEYNPDWKQGSLVHLYVSGHKRSQGNGITHKFSESTKRLKFLRQEIEKQASVTKIVTVLEAEKEYQVVHVISHTEGDSAVECQCTFKNISNTAQKLELLTSFSLDGLSPMQEGDQTDKLCLHRFLGGWSLEGKHIVSDVEDLGLQKGWCSAFPLNEKFGSLGSYPVEKYFSTALVEDKEHGIMWGAQIAHNASWQMELTRYGDTLSFSGGLSDADYGAWSKTILPLEEFAAPKCYLTVKKGNYEETCQRLTAMQEKACEAYGEKGLPIVFNEYCSSWGNPTEEKMLKYAECLKGHHIQYVVIDAGWSEGSKEQYGNGEWVIDKKRFPDMKRMNEKLRKAGYIPGIWCEVEVTTEGSVSFGKEFDNLHLQRDGEVIQTGEIRTFWDFRQAKVRNLVKERLVQLLRGNGFGYLKVDYNGNTGIGCDGTESMGEELRSHLQYVREFFVELKKEIPDLVIENCASGSHRMEPSMIGVTAMTSFSDAHEAREIPYIAASQHNLILPRQNQIWIVLHQDDTMERTAYSLAAGFLGRMCLSGDVDKLSEEKWKMVDDAIAFYQKSEDVILQGVSRIYGNRGKNVRHPEGTQVVVREGESEILVICHGFGNTAEEMLIPIDIPCKMAAEFYNQWITIDEKGLKLRKMKEWTACAVLLKK